MDKEKRHFSKKFIHATNYGIEPQMLREMYQKPGSVWFTDVHKPKNSLKPIIDEGIKEVKKYLNKAVDDYKTIPGMNVVHLQQRIKNAVQQLDLLLS